MNLMNKNESKLIELARDRLDRDDVFSALKYFNQVLELNPCNEEALEQARELLVYELYDKPDKDFKKPIELSLRSIKSNPKNPKAWSYLGHIFKIKGDFNKAIECFSKAVELEPDNWRNWTNLGLVYRNVGMIELGNKILFNYSVYMNSFSNIQDMIYDFRLEKIYIVLDISEPTNRLIKQVLSDKLNFVLLSFQIKNTQLTENTGKKILKLLEKLKTQNKVHIKIIRPLPRCLFSSLDYQNLVNQCGMPKNCENCLELGIMQENQTVKFCNGKKERLLKNNRKELYNKFIRAHNFKIKKKCKDCINSVRRQCCFQYME